MPLNAKYQHFNGSGTEPARLASIHDMPFLMNLFRNQDFIFTTEHDFLERLGPNGYFQGEGQMIEIRPGRHQWETNFVSDITNFELKSWAERGKGSSSPEMGFIGLHSWMPYFPNYSWYIQKGAPSYMRHERFHD